MNKTLNIHRPRERERERERGREKKNNIRDTELERKWKLFPVPGYGEGGARGRLPLTYDELRSHHPNYGCRVEFSAHIFLVLILAQFDTELKMANL